MRRLSQQEQQLLRDKIAQWIRTNLVTPGTGIPLKALFDNVGAGAIYYNSEHDYPKFGTNETVTRRSFRLLVRQVFANKKDYKWNPNFDVRLAQVRVTVRNYKERRLKNGTIMRIPVEKESVRWCVVHTTPEIVRGNLIWRDKDHGGMITSYGQVEADTTVTRRMDETMDAVEETNREVARTGLVPDHSVPAKPKLKV